MGLRTSAVLCAVIAATICAGARAAEVPIPNGDFALPDASTSFGTLFTIPGAPTSWTGTNASTGVFNNTLALVPWPGPALGLPPLPAPYTSLFINNLGLQGPAAAAGKQSVFLDVAPGVEIHQSLATTYAQDQTYTLNFGVLASIDGIPFTNPIANGSPFKAVLYYGNDPTNVVSTATVHNADGSGTDPNTQDQNNLTMFSFQTPVTTDSSPWLGQDIGIQFIIPSDITQSGGVWSLGNVDLTSVPEPASLTVLAGGAFGLLFRRRRAAR